jgi:hypothetical protein
MNKAVVQICAFCWLFLLRLIMHGTNVELYFPKLFRLFTVTTPLLLFGRYNAQIIPVSKILHPSVRTGLSLIGRLTVFRRKPN